MESCRAVLNNLNNPTARQVVGVSIVFSVVSAIACAQWPGSGGRTAAALSGVNLGLFCLYAFIKRDRQFANLLSSAGAFGLVELVADHLCIRHTGTLDYSVARSALLWESPWWMPLSWAVVAVQVGVCGDVAIARCGVVRGTLLTGLLGALLIPFYEEMAWSAHWWRYQNCLLLSHTPVYIIVAEAIIAAGLTLWGYLTLRTRSLQHVLLLGAAAGLVTIIGGIIGWGLVEFLFRGMRPLP